MVANPTGIHSFPTKHGSSFKPVPGYDVRVLNDAGHLITQRNTEGNLVVKLPLPPGT
jgi:propionyl-CoA synthetase